MPNENAMPTERPALLTFYPAYCFHLSKTYKAWVRLTAANVHALEERAGFEGQNIYFYLNHPIRWVQLIGVVVALDLFTGVTIITIDDGSGTNIEVKHRRSTQVPSDLKHNAIPRNTESNPITHDHPPVTKGVTPSGREISLPQVDVGTVIRVKGGITTYRGQRQIALERIEIVRSTSEEIASWAKTTAFFNNVLARPWAISTEDETNARGKAEGRERQRLRAEMKNEQKARKKVSKAAKDDKESRRRIKETAADRKANAGRKKREEEGKKLAEERGHERHIRRQRQKYETEQALKESGGGR